MPKINTQGDRQVGKTGVPLEPFMATFVDDEGEPLVHLPIKFVQVAGDGQLDALDGFTGLSGEAVAELTPGTAPRGRIELRYGEGLNESVAFTYSLDTAAAEILASMPPRPTTTPAPAVSAPAKTSTATPVRKAAPKRKARIIDERTRIGATALGALASGATVTVRPAPKPRTRIIDPPPPAVTRRPATVPAAAKPRPVPETVPTAPASGDRIFAIATMITIVVVMGLGLLAFTSRSEPTTPGAIDQLMVDCSGPRERRVVNGRSVILCELKRSP